MEFEQVMRGRFSCRAFLPEHVPDEVIDEMFGLAQLTASWCNTQPWQVYLVTGEEAKRFGLAYTEHVRSNDPSPDLPMPPSYSGVYLERRRESGFGLYKSLNIAREDYAARDAQAMLNYSFFGAPHIAVVTSDREQGVYGAIDCGGFVANLLNAAATLGIATIPQAAIATHSQFVHSFLDVPESRTVVCGVSFGYQDASHPANSFRTGRADLDDVIVRWTAT